MFPWPKRVKKNVGIHHNISFKCHIVLMMPWFVVVFPFLFSTFLLVFLEFTSFSSPHKFYLLFLLCDLYPLKYFISFCTIQLLVKLCKLPLTKCGLDKSLLFSLLHNSHIICPVSLSWVSLSPAFLFKQSWTPFVCVRSSALIVQLSRLYFVMSGTFMCLNFDFVSVGTLCLIISFTCSLDFVCCLHDFPVTILTVDWRNSHTTNPPSQIKKTVCFHPNWTFFYQPPTVPQIAELIWAERAGDAAAALMRCCTQVGAAPPLSRRRFISGPRRWVLSEKMILYTIRNW